MEQEGLAFSRGAGRALFLSWRRKGSLSLVEEEGLSTVVVVIEVLDEWSGRAQGSVGGYWRVATEQRQGCMRVCAWCTWSMVMLMVQCSDRRLGRREWGLGLSQATSMGQAVDIDNQFSTVSIHD